MVIFEKKTFHYDVLNLLPTGSFFNKFFTIFLRLLFFLWTLRRIVG